jgi:hypothetical protein
MSAQNTFIRTIKVCIDLQVLTLLVTFVQAGQFVLNIDSVLQAQLSANSGLPISCSRPLAVGKS